MVKIKETKNEFGIDLIRILAMFFVIALHFYLHTGFYHVKDKGPAILYHVSFRALFYECVPLFLLLTGYLKRNAAFTPSHYVKAIPVILNSLVIGGITIAFKILYLHENFPVLLWIKSMWRLEQPSYGWYVNMYLSLMIFIPFINAAYHAMKTKKQKLAAVIVVVLATTLALTINRIPVSETIDKTIGLPLNYFSGMWPFAYYVCGMYIGEFRPKCNRILMGSITVELCIFTAFLNYITVDTDYYSGINLENGDILTLMIAVSLFLTLYDIQIKNKYIRWAAAKISSLSISCYLMSYIVDVLMYRKYRPMFTDTYDYVFPMFWKIVPLDFLISVLLSIPVHLLCTLLLKYVFHQRRWCRAGTGETHRRAAGVKTHS